MPADQTPPLTTAELDALEAAAKSPRTGLDATVAMVLRLVAEVRRLRAASVVPASPAVEMPREAPPGTVRVRAEVLMAADGKDWVVREIGRPLERRPLHPAGVLVADISIPIPLTVPVVQARVERVEPALAKEGGAS